MPLTPQTHSGHELAARAAIAAALIASKTIPIEIADDSKSWRDSPDLVKLSNATDLVFKAIADKR